MGAQKTSEGVPTNPYTFSGAVSGEEYAALRLGEFSAASFHTAQHLNDQGTTFTLAGRYKEAEAVLSKAVEIKERLLGPSHPLLATSLANLADVYLSCIGGLELDGCDKLEKAHILSKRALDIRDPKNPKLENAQTTILATIPPGQ
eukprot:8344444-Pyramimonas_sp.AAC.1